MGINKQQTILTVDDNARNLDLLDGFLREGNYNIIRAENGEKALELIRNNNIDLILLDIMMPGLDGYQVCEELKKMPEYSSVPVIFLTAKHDVESMVKGFNVGAVDYLTKPINIEEFNARVNTHLRLRRKELELKQYDIAKNRFIANIAEDLLSPIESLRSVLKMLNDSSGTLEKELMQDYISLAYSASDCLNAISQNLKQWSALQNNEFPADPKNINAYEIFNDVIDTIQAVNKTKSITINNKIASNEFVYFDEKYLNIIATNILSNAVSFSYKGSAVNISSEDSNIDGSLTIVIEDEGIGISPEDQEYLFQLGKQNRRKGTAGEIGTGMGLVLCHDLLLKSNCRIWVESKLDSGTKMYFNLLQGR